MKKNFIALFTFIFFAGISCQEKIDIEKEKEAVKAVIENETNSHYARDFDQQMKSLLQDESLAGMGANKSGYSYVEGWENISSRYKKNHENSPDPSKDKFEFKNYKIKVHKESALAVYDQLRYDSEGELLISTLQVRFLEKVKGEWKISFMSLINTSSYLNAESNKRIATTYHKLEPEDINDILTDDFIGRNEKSRHTWNKEDHINFHTNNPDIIDTIYNQGADGNWVTTRFQRKMNWQGKDVEFEAMHFKRFENGKIAEIWEYGDSKQVD